MNRRFCLVFLPVVMASGPLSAFAAPVIRRVSQAPAVPRAGEGLVVAAALEGAGNAALRWRVSGATAFQSATMRESGGTWTAVIPPHEAGVVVEFTVGATSGDGETVWPAEGRPALVQFEENPAATGVWTPGAAAVWRLVVRPGDQAGLAAGSPVTVSAGVRDGSGSAVFHGSTLRQREASPKSYELTFSGTESWRGREAVCLHAGRPHAEAFGAAVMQRAGLAAAAVETVEVRLNGVNAAAAGAPSYGRFALSDRLDSAWVRRQFPLSADGNLYWLDDRGPGTHGALAWETPATAANYAETYFKLTNQSAADYSDVIALTGALSNAPEASYRESLSARLDLPQWLTFLAVDALLGNGGPGLQTGRGTDVALYQQPVSGLMQLVPAGLREIAGLGASAGTESRSLFSSGATAGLSRMMGHPSVLPEYTRTLQALLEDTFRPEVLHGLTGRVMSGWVPPGEIATVENYLAARRASALAQLPAEYSALEVRGEAPPVEGMATTATGTLVLRGRFPVAEAGSVLVNGQPALLQFRDGGTEAAGTWTFTASGDSLHRGVQTFLVEFFSGPGGTGTRLHSLTGTGFYSGGGTVVTSITAPPSINETLTAPGGNPPAAAPEQSDWRYLAAAAPSGWQDSGFDDREWAAGTPHFGFGETDQRTTLPNEPGRVTCYFRRTFPVAETAAGTYTALSLKLLYDDGAIVYLNGTEVARRNLPASGVTDATGASSNRTSGENAFETVSLNAFTGLLRAGLNTLAVEVHNHTGAGADDLSFDAELTGTRPASPDVRWTAAGSPYRLPQSLTVPSGVTLAIDPGVSVFFEPGRKLTLGSGAVLKVLGTPYGRVRFSHVPGSPLVDDTDIPGTQTGPPKWHGITIEGSLSPRNRISFADFDNGQVTGFDGTLNINRSVCTIEHCTFRGTKYHAIRGDSSSLTVTDCHFYTGYLPGENPLTLGLDNASEFIQLGTSGGGTGFTGNWPTGGVLRFYRNTFEALPGHNDAMDVQSGKWGVTPVLDVQDNIFSGPTGDEGIDLEGDVYIAGNFFANIRKDDYTEDLGYANALSLGDPADAADTTAVIARNVFTRVDHVVSLKGNTGAIVEHNTIACQNNDYPFNHGTQPQTVRSSVVGFYIPEDNKTPGDGAYLAYNILFGSSAHQDGTGPSGFPRVFGFADSKSTTTKLELFANFIDPAIQDPVIGVRHPDDVLHPSWGTVTGDPWFVDVAADNYALLPGSPAAARAPGGFDYGAGIAKGCYLTGVPPAVTDRTSAAVTVGGPGIFAYQWRLNGGAWSAPVNIAPGYFPRTGPTVRTAVLTLTGLAPGPQTLEVTGRDFAGNWTPEDEAVRVSWTVDPVTPLVFLNEIQAGGGVELSNGGSLPVPLSGWFLTDDPAVPGKFPLSGTLAPGALLMAGPGESGITLPAAGGAVWLYQNGILRDAVHFGPQSAAYSFGRMGRGQLWTPGIPTPSAENQETETGEVAALQFSEWLAGPGGWIELRNTGSLPVQAGGLVLTANRPGGVRSFTFPANSLIGPGAVLLLQADGGAAPGHLPFVIEPGDGGLVLLDGTRVLDSTGVSSPVAGCSEGRLPAGALAWFSLPTPGAVNGPASAATFAAWLGQYGLTAASDGDGDGASALMEYACGTDPRDPRSVVRPEVLRDGSGLSLTLPQSPRGDVLYTLEQTADPGDPSAWVTAAAMEHPAQWTGAVTATAGPGEGGMIPVTLQVPPGRFFRFRFAVR